MKTTILSGKGWRILLSDLELELSFLPLRVMVSPWGPPRARPKDMTTPGPLLPPYGVIVGVLLHLIVYLVAVLYR